MNISLCDSIFDGWPNSAIAHGCRDPPRRLGQNIASWLVTLKNHVEFPKEVVASFLAVTLHASPKEYLNPRLFPLSHATPTNQPQTIPRNVCCYPLQAPAPAELVEKIIRGFTLAESARVIRVNSVWRNEVVRRREYWQHPLIKDMDPGAIEFFLARLRQSHGRPIEITVDFHDTQQTKLVAIAAAQRILPAVGRALPCITNLFIRLTLDQTRFLSECIQKSSAPLLHTLYVAVCGRDSDKLLRSQLIKVNSNWLSNHAPLLRNLTLVNVSCGSVMPAWFAGVHELRLGADLFKLTLRLSDVLSPPSALRRLWLLDHVSLDHVANNHIDPAMLSNLVEVNLGHSAFQYNWRQLGLSLFQDLPNLTVFLSDDNALNNFLHLLPGTLTAAVEVEDPDDMEGQIRIEFQNIIPGLASGDPSRRWNTRTNLFPHTVRNKRMVLQTVDYWTQPSYAPRQIFETGWVRNRLTLLRIPLRSFSFLVRNMRKEFPELLYLAFDIGTEGLNNLHLNLDQNVKINAPRLLTVAFCALESPCGSSKLILDAASMIHLVRQTLGQECPPAKQISVQLLDLDLDGQHSARMLLDAFAGLSGPLMHQM
ncbi:hypothetical protein BKA62DRAFT_774581 [Auriculariales sp. MPI-PUGE-AT-0066]|nr:hypothetical protein BKA62DRAFT_774581 [Auriculariales sp. MPI-PUGE-AT-0066]